MSNTNTSLVHANAICFLLLLVQSICMMSRHVHSCPPHFLLAHVAAGSGMPAAQTLKKCMHTIPCSLHGLVLSSLPQRGSGRSRCRFHDSGQQVIDKFHQQIPPRYWNWAGRSVEDLTKFSLRSHRDPGAISVGVVPTTPNDPAVIRARRKRTPNPGGIWGDIPGHP